MRSRRWTTRRRQRRQIDWDLYTHGIQTDALQERLQRGGAVRCKQKTGTVTVDGVRYTYFCYVDDENTLLFNGGPQQRPCFALTIQPAERTAVLVTLNNRPGCSLDIGATAKTAGKAAFALAAERGVRQITLTDNAVKHLEPGDKGFVVSDMEFLTTGRTWYESFLPVQPTRNIDADRMRIQANTWDKVFRCLHKRHPDVVVPVDISDIATNRKGSARAVFQRIKEAHTDFFVRYRQELPLCSGIPTLFGTTWTADIGV